MHTSLLGQPNVLAVRVHTIPLGTRNDTVPWGLIDWWNYGGLTGPVWLEASTPSHVARADVVTHLDAVDVEVLLDHSETVGWRTERGARWRAGRARRDGDPAGDDPGCLGGR